MTLQWPPLTSWCPVTSSNLKRCWILVDSSGYYRQFASADLAPFFLFFLFESDASWKRRLFLGLAMAIHDFGTTIWGVFAACDSVWFGCLLLLAISTPWLFGQNHGFPGPVMDYETVASNDSLTDWWSRCMNPTEYALWDTVACILSVYSQLGGSDSFAAWHCIESYSDIFILQQAQAGCQSLWLQPITESQSLIDNYWEQISDSHSLLANHW